MCQWNRLMMSRVTCCTSLKQAQPAITTSWIIAVCQASQVASANPRPCGWIFQFVYSERPSPIRQGPCFKANCRRPGLPEEPPKKNNPSKGSQLGWFMLANVLILRFGAFSHPILLLCWAKLWDMTSLHGPCLIYVRSNGSTFFRSGGYKIKLRE